MVKRRPTNSYYTPPVTPPSVPLVTRKALVDMDRNEAIAYTEQLIARLRKKQARERAYLDRRTKRGTHTPTDEAYEDDQLLEEELVAVLEEMLSGLKEGQGTP